MGEIGVIIGLLRLLGKKSRFKLLLLFAVIAISSVLQVITIGTLYPIIAIVSAKSEMRHTFKMPFIIDAAIGSLNTNPLSVYLVIFLSAVFLSALFKIVDIWLSQNIAASLGTYISSYVFKSNLERDYVSRHAFNSSNLINAITHDSDQTVVFVEEVLKLLYNIVLVISIFATLIAVSPIPIISISTVIIGMYYLIFSRMRYSLYNSGADISELSSKRLKNMQEGLASFRTLILFNLTNKFLNRHRELDSSMRNARARSGFIAASPKPILELIGYICIGLLGWIQYLVTRNNDLTAYIGIFAFGFQRLLPSINTVYQSFSNIQTRLASVQSVLTYWNHSAARENISGNFGDNLKKQSPLEYFARLDFENVLFNYPGNDRNVLDGIDFSLATKESIAIIGVSGGGKTTFLDLLAGFLIPSGGAIKVNNVDINKNVMMRSRWQSSLGYAPQTTYIFDSSVCHNISLEDNTSNIDFYRLNYLLKCLELTDVFDSTEKIRSVNLGEFGTKLSGGQRQRIGIARALYRNCAVLLLDESTSAVDMKMENRIMKEITKSFPDIASILVTHRHIERGGVNKTYRLSNRGLQIV